jgi:hypothetical protein
MEKKLSDEINEEICQRFGIDGLEFRGHFSEEEKASHEARILNDLAYMSKTLGIKEDDIGLGGFHLTVSKPVGGESSYGAYFPNEHVMATYYYQGGYECGVFAHEWFHALDHQIAEHFHLKNGYFTNAMIAGEIDSDSVKALTGISPESVIASEEGIRKRCEEIERTCGIKEGNLSSHAEISARAFEFALVKNTDHTFIGDFPAYSWAPKGMPVYPTKEEAPLLCNVATRTVSGVSQAGIIQALKQDRGLIKEYPDLDFSEIQGVKKPQEELQEEPQEEDYNEFIIHDLGYEDDLSEEFSVSEGFSNENLDLSETQDVKKPQEELQEEPQEEDYDEFIIHDLGYEDDLSEEFSVSEGFSNENLREPDEDLEL